MSSKNPLDKGRFYFWISEPIFLAETSYIVRVVIKYVYSIEINLVLKARIIASSQRKMGLYDGTIFKIIEQSIFAVNLSTL